MNNIVEGLMSAVVGLALIAPLAHSTVHAATATAKPLKVFKTVEIAASPVAVWEKIKNFDALNTWHPAFASDEIVKGENNKVGAVCKLTVKDGPSFTEQLLPLKERVLVPLMSDKLLTDE